MGRTSLSDQEIWSGRFSHRSYPDMRHAIGIESRRAALDKSEGTIAPGSFNLRAGGANGALHESSKAILSAKAKLRRPTPETIAKRAAALRGRKMTPEHRARMSIYLTGRKMPPGFGAKISALKKGTIVSAESRRKMSEARRGKKLSPYARFMTQGENNKKSKLTTIAVHQIRSRYAAGGISQPALAAEFGVSQTVIWSIVRHKTWKHVDERGRPHTNVGPLEVSRSDNLAA